MPCRHTLTQLTADRGPRIRVELQENAGAHQPTTKPNTTNKRCIAISQ